MDKVNEQLNGLKNRIPVVVDEFQHYVELIKDQIPTNYEELQPHIDYIKSITKDDVINDFKELKVSPITISLTLVALTTLLIFGKIFSSGGSSTTSSSDKKSTKSKKPKKKLSKAQKANKSIQAILDFVESEYVPQIDKYIDNYKSLKSDEAEYKYNYFEEMLLKELMKLDGIDVSSNDILRENRRKVVKFIQDHQKRLDKLKKEFK
ncbi:uncharacterized protein J8A68_002836 [[Candida] subhashii]|uniref:BAG domain-containing protein n=1 Tax=[Candida] subhashii TaxID=561895 RepID=A0A8J5UND3_9ASCO|nr:uncharacterized protein J8A68_002836 [[Candida] subhashii]KAG7663587.1 hypothetical protein J8A68_002836 [[Candida] subhashii]